MKKRQVTIIEKVTRSDVDLKRLALFSAAVICSAALLSSFLTAKLVQKSPETGDKVLAQNSPAPKVEDNTPVRILLPTQGIDLPIQVAPVLRDTWQVFENSAGLGANTTKNNLVIFAHARPGMFDHLGELRIGDHFYLFGTTKWQNFEIIEKSYILPEDINTVLKTANTRLTVTLFSCDGPNDEKRVVIKAILSDHSKGGDI